MSGPRRSGRSAIARSAPWSTVPPASSGAARRRSTAILCSAPCSSPKATPSCRAANGGCRSTNQVSAETALPPQHPDPAPRGSPTPTAGSPRFSTSARASSAAAGCTGRSPSSRIVRPLAGAPRIESRSIPPPAGARARRPSTSGTNHVRYPAEPQPLRLTTDAPVSHCSTAAAFRLEEPHAFLPRPRRAVRRRCRATRSRRCCTRPSDDWRAWVRGLAIPLEWQEVVIRAAITLKLCQHEETGAIVAALTTSIPEAADSRPQLGLSLLLDPRRLLHGPGAEPARRARRARRLSRLSAQRRRRCARRAYPAALRRIGRADARGEGRRTPRRLSRHGPGAGRQCRPTSRSSTTPTARSSSPTPRPSSTSGCCARRRRRFRARWRRSASAPGQLHDKPDAGLWEFRTRSARAHLFSAVMCWAACDRLATPPPRSGWPTARELWREPRRDDPRDDREARLVSRTRAALRRDLRRRRARRQPAAAGRHALPRARRSALPRHLRGGREGRCGAATTCCATPPRTISASPRRRSTSAPSG